MASRNKKISRTVNRFSEVPKAQIPRSTFNRSHGLKTTFDAGYLIPIYVDDVLPGDTFNMSMNGFARLATPLKPVMDNLYLETFFFFVPNRLVWDRWVNFMGEQPDPSDTTDYIMPTVSIPTGAGVESLYDYMGWPVLPGGRTTSHALPMRAYNLIWNDWFRDQNLQDSVDVPMGNGPDDVTIYQLKRRGKRHDYFTSALPWPQKPYGTYDTGVTIPLGDRASVNVDLASGNAIGVNSADGFTNMDASVPFLTTSLQPAIEANSLYADLKTATAVTINTLRQGFQIQKMLERDARGGTRYTEIIKSHFGVTSPDARLQRPEYLGGGSTPITISPVAQTSTSGAGTTFESDTPQGNLAAVGTASWSGHGFQKSFTEHGYIIGLASVRADLTYQQGLSRHWSRSSRFDFYFPALAHLGEQAVLNKEIYQQDADGTVDDGVFGYQERFAEYRYKPSMITGKFRSQIQPGDDTDLDVWHLAQEFSALPGLNQAFIEENPPMDRVLAVSSEPDFLFDAWFNLKCARPMPVYGVPGLIDHF